MELSNAESVVEKKKRSRLLKSEKSLSLSETSTETIISVTTDPKSKMTDAKSNIESKSGGGAVASIKTLFHYEESEVANRDPQKDLELHKAVCNEIRNAMSFIQEAKYSEDTTQGQQAMDDMAVHGTLQFVSLKKLNRIGHFRSKKMRDATNDAKQKVDQQHLKLQNLLYEVMHLQKEIGKCLQFCSKDEEIPLIGVDQFYAEAPPEISRPETTRHDEHQLTLARLDWELEQRKCLSVALTEAQARKDEMATDIVEKKAYLESLRPKLNSILQSTKPVQEYLDMPFDEVLEQHRVAADLPAALYVLFIQASAYGEACDKHINVAIQVR